jgi:hypothetical protein
MDVFSSITASQRFAFLGQEMAELVRPCVSNLLSHIKLGLIDDTVADSKAQPTIMHDFTSICKICLTQLRLVSADNKLKHC